MGDDVQNPTPTTPPATGTPISDTSTIGPDFSQVPGHMEHKSAAAAAHDRSTFTSLTGDINNATAPIENYTPEGRKEHPILSKIGDVTRGVKELLEGGQAVGKGMGTSSGMVNNPLSQLIMTGPDAAIGAASAEDYVAENAPKVAEHIAETGRTFVRGAKAGMERAAAATAPEGSLEAGFAKIPGHQVERPNPQITSEGPAWERVHTAKVDGKIVGKVGVKTDPSGRAQIYGAVVPEDMRGKGIAQKLYGAAIDDAHANPEVTHLTSDSTNTTPAAHRVWHKMVEKNAYPIEEITHPNGKPGYQITFDRAGESNAPAAEEAKTEKPVEVPEHIKERYGPDVKGAEAAAKSEPATMPADMPDHLKAQYGTDVEGAKNALRAEQGLPKENLEAGAPGAEESAPQAKEDVLKKVAEKYGETEDPYKISHGASFITPEGKYIHLGGGIDHNRAIENVTGVMDGSKDNRPDFLNSTGAIRTRMTFGREGHTLHVSVPEKGITAEQVDALKAAAHQGLGGGKNGNIVMETATGGKSAEEQFANANNIEPMLKKIGAHPEGAEPQEWHQRAEEESKKAQGK
jgi:predicted GNAT family acetyltransferase